MTSSIEAMSEAPGQSHRFPNLPKDLKPEYQLRGFEDYPQWKARCYTELRLVGMDTLVVTGEMPHDPIEQESIDDLPGLTLKCDCNVCYYHSDLLDRLSAWILKQMKPSIFHIFQGTAASKSAHELMQVLDSFFKTKEHEDTKALAITKFTYLRSQMKVKSKPEFFFVA